MKNLILAVALLTSVDAFAQANRLRSQKSWQPSYNKIGKDRAVNSASPTFSYAKPLVVKQNRTATNVQNSNSNVEAQERARIETERAAQVAAQEQARLAAEADAAALVAQQGTPGGTGGITWVTYPSTTFLDGTVSTLPFTSYTNGQSCIDRGFVYVQFLNNNGTHSSTSDGCYVRGAGNDTVFNSLNCGRLVTTLSGTSFDENNQNINYCRPNFHGGGYHSICFAEQQAGLEPSPDCVEEASHTVTVVPVNVLKARVDATGGAGCYDSYQLMISLSFGGGNNEVIYRHSNGIDEIGVGVITGGGDYQCSFLRGTRGNNLQSVPSSSELSSHSRAETGACPLSVVREFRKNAPRFATECKETYQGVEMSVSYDIP